MNALFLMLVGACSGTDKESDTGSEALVDSLTPPDPSEGFQVSMTTTVEPFTEAWICQVYTIPIEEMTEANRRLF